MEVSSELCRAQEAIHRDRAANTGLDNVRIISETAAVAWAREAVAAEKREARRARVEAIAAIAKLQQKRTDED